MPRTASSQVQLRPSSKARPYANVRAGNLVANTPVLFRLPAIQTASAQDLSVNFSEAASNLPTATLAAVALSTASPIVAPAAKPAEPVSNVSVTSQVAPQQTWWEHWSSGIVLIVLLIALATASILAWQGSGKGNSKLMADTKETDIQSDLSNIEVPKIENPRLEFPKQEIPVSTNSNSFADKLEPPSAQNARSQSNSTQNGTTENKSFDQKTDDIDSSLIPNESLSLTLDSPAINAMKFEPEPHATASLQSPVVKPQEPLFKDSDLIQAKSNVSAQPASTPTQRSATNGDKPALWDNSKTNVHDSNKPLSLEFSSNDSSSLSSSTASANQPTNDVTNTAKLISQSTTEAPRYAAETTPSTLVPKDLQYAVKTVTPEMDQAELFAAYRELKAPAAPTKVVNRFGAAASAGTSSQPTGAPGIQAPGIQAAVVGYTQKSTTQPNPQTAPGNPNYTLQPAQNYPASSGMQQYPAMPNPSQQVPPPQYQSQLYQGTQYSNPQSAGTQYSGTQYSGAQYSGQQYSGQQNPPLPQYSAQPQMGTQNSGGMQMQGAPSQSTGAAGLQYGGAQVPYTAQPSQPSALQLPPGPIGGYGPQPGTQGGTAGGSSSPSYPSMQ